MIKGVLAKDHRPYIEVVVGWKQVVQVLPVLIDTGFNGELKIPERTARELGLKITHITAVLLADETGKKVPASLAHISLEGTRKMVNVIVAASIPTIGTKLLNDFSYKLAVNFVSKEVGLYTEINNKNVDDVMEDIRKEVKDNLGDE